MAPQTRSKTRKLSAATTTRPTTQPPSKFLSLPPSLRLSIYTHLLASPRPPPFLIGRCQDHPHTPHNRSPRDFFPGAHHVPRNDRPHRPAQPPITRVRRQLRAEALPLFYSENAFWLIHNEFSPAASDAEEAGASEARPRRNFNAWVAQTPVRMFDVMRRVSLCGYQAWPNRIMIDVDLKDRSIGAVRAYSTYGDELEVYQDWVDSIHAVLAAEGHVNGLTALKAVMAVCDGIWDLQTEHISAPPGLSRARKPQSGPEYDW
ncbi:hypothetical protein BDV95DRAFT_643867 [Massariosphaeria phaeospora]|uniref:F-box domain-containing protein n=1 Tax=Massariosphaeria phaeospora TaxID=100035 RepID=A0A7C8MU79_9PLEO|nr:hypothetical protein BDV95DRAFT_643867 [Massariosphaeria phaeospora]